MCPILSCCSEDERLVSIVNDALTKLEVLRFRPVSPQGDR